MTTRMTKGVVPPFAISDLVKLLLPIKPAVEKPVMLKSKQYADGSQLKRAKPSAYL